MATRFPAGFPAFSPGTKPTRKLSTGHKTSAFGSLLGRGLRPVRANFPRGIAPGLKTSGRAPPSRLPEDPDDAAAAAAAACRSPPPTSPLQLLLHHRLLSAATSTSVSGESTSVLFSLASARVSPLSHTFSVDPAEEDCGHERICEQMI